MFKSLVLIVTLFLAAPDITTFGDTDTRNLDAFTSVAVSGSITVDLVKSDVHKVEIEMLKGDIKDLLSEVNDGHLKLKFKSNKNYTWGGNKNKAKVTLYYTELDGIDVSAGSKVSSDHALNASDMEIDASSGASIRVELDVNDLDVDVSSGASVKIAGSAKQQSIDVSSGASYSAGDLKSDYCDVDASSGASVKVWVEKEFTADASSGASIRYKGDPSDTNIDAGKYSGGSIKKI